jgi:hypothetical protein
MNKINYLGPNNEKPIIAIIEDFFNEKELKLIWQELDFLNPKLLGPEQTGTARNEDGLQLKNNFGLFLDNVYSDRNVSNILNINRKLFSVGKELIEYNYIFDCVNSCNLDTTLISYYENSNHYKPHRDTSILTILSYFWKEPKSFKGGNLLLTDFNFEIEVKNNMVIFMPGSYRHEVTEIVMDKRKKNYGRYCMSVFLNYR